MKTELVMYRTEHGWRPAFVAEGRKRLHVVLQDSPMTVAKVDMSEQRYMKPLDYPLKKAIKTFRKLGRVHGLTKSVAALLKGVTV